MAMQRWCPRKYFCNTIESRPPEARDVKMCTTLRMETVEKANIVLACSHARFVSRCRRDVPLLCTIIAPMPAEKDRSVMRWVCPRRDSVLPSTWRPVQSSAGIFFYFSHLFACVAVRSARSKFGRRWPPTLGVSLL